MIKANTPKVPVASPVTSHESSERTLPPDMEYKRLQGKQSVITIPIHLTLQHRQAQTRLPQPPTLRPTCASTSSKKANAFCPGSTSLPANVRIPTLLSNSSFAGTHTYQKRELAIQVSSKHEIIPQRGSSRSGCQMALCQFKMRRSGLLLFYRRIQWIGWMGR